MPKTPKPHRDQTLDSIGSVLGYVFAKAKREDTIFLEFSQALLASALEKAFTEALGHGTFVGGSAAPKHSIILWMNAPETATDENGVPLEDILGTILDKAGFLATVFVFNAHGTPLKLTKDAARTIERRLREIIMKRNIYDVIRKGDIPA